jgi:S-adenosylmethionine:tRNA ribosyltransferase-isomerase
MIPLSDYDYTLPESLIADVPSTQRENSKLLILDRATKLTHDANFYDIVNYFNSGDCLVINNTKVIPARLVGKKKSGGKVEILLLEKTEDDHWVSLVKPSRRLPVDTELEFSNGLSAIILKDLNDGKRLISFLGSSRESIFSSGKLPIPPYIKYDSDKDVFYQDRYQTVFADQEGAVAAPTAGLHFSKDLLEKLRLKGVNILTVTLHVGIGTFKPVDCPDMTKHKIHGEYYTLSETTVNSINDCKKNNGKVVAVGTTTTRVLEGVTELNGKLVAGSGTLHTFIYPGFCFKIVDKLITNFHLPKSSLLLMVSAFADRTFIFNSYQHAIKCNYRFYSFGDAMLIL